MGYTLDGWYATFHGWSTDYATGVSIVPEKPYLFILDYDDTRASGSEQIKQDIKFMINGIDYDWIDGRKPESQLNTGDSSLVIGSRLDGGDPFIGQILEILVFNTILNDSEKTKVQNYLSHVVATVDSDGDGLTDSEEDVLGTNPLMPGRDPLALARMGPVDAATNYTLDDGSTVMIFKYDDSTTTAKAKPNTPLIFRPMWWRMC